MSARNVLVVVLDEIPDEKIRTAIQTRKAVADVTVHVVAPAASAGVLQWLTGAEDEARAEAEELAVHTAEAVEAEVETETEVGDRDPLVAAEDALRTFPADEIVLAGEASAATETALRRFGLPVSRLNGESGETGEETAAAGAVVRRLTRGRSSETPLVLLGAVGGVVLGAIVFIGAIALLVYWLV